MIGLGTWQTFDVRGGEAERRPLEDVRTTFVSMGGTVVDSSPMYGRAERVVGDLAATLGLSARLFMATKVWTSGEAAGLRQIEQSFEKLRTPADTCVIPATSNASHLRDNMQAGTGVMPGERSGGESWTRRSERSACDRRRISGMLLATLRGPHRSP